MATSRLLRAALGSALFFAGCREATGPGMQGRWAARGIELIAQPNTAQIRFPCAATVRLPYGLVRESTDSVRFSTTVTSTGTSFTLDFIGQFQGDTLAATVSRTWTGYPPLVENYLMVPDGNPDFTSYYCLD